MGDSVVICGRDDDRLAAAVDALQQSEKAAVKGDESPSARVWGIRCDVANAEDLASLAEFAVEQMGGVDIWINNAGQVTSKSLLADVPPSDIASAVSTNVLGSLLGCREAIRVMRQQADETQSAATPRYHIFNLGFSRWGAAFTRSAATHKSTKMALSQLTTSLNDELNQAGLTSISVHNLSPGMVLTDLLLKDSTPIARRFFNALAEEPETVAAAIVPLIRGVTAPNENVEYMSPVDAFIRVVTGVPQIVKDRECHLQAYAKQAAVTAPLQYSVRCNSFFVQTMADIAEGLTEEQKQQYFDQGYLVLEDFWTPDDCSRMMQRIDELLEGFDPNTVNVFSTRDQARLTNDYFLDSGRRVSFFFEEKAFDADKKLVKPKKLAINKVGHALHDLDSVFGPLSRSSKVASLCKSLGFRRPLPVQSMYIFKQPGIGGEVVPHQDSSFLYTDPPSCVGVWVAVQDATVENGCLYALPGSHKDPLARRFVRDGKCGVTFDAPSPTYDLTQFVPVPVKAGTAVILHGQLVHFSYENKSPVSRHAYSMHIVESDGPAYPSDNWLQVGPVASRTREVASATPGMAGMRGDEAVCMGDVDPPPRKGVPWARIKTAESLLLQGRPAAAARLAERLLAQLLGKGRGENGEGLARGAGNGDEGEVRGEGKADRKWRIREMGEKRGSNEDLSDSAEAALKAVGVVWVQANARMGRHSHVLSEFKRFFGALSLVAPPLFLIWLSLAVSAREFPGQCGPETALVAAACLALILLTRFRAQANRVFSQARSATLQALRDLWSLAFTVNLSPLAVAAQPATGAGGTPFS
ncbi:unnamed protein product [Closterium sp. Yama58-4]|nr:unnamed protein product [Closterium sp. Yama58-4]